MSDGIRLPVVSLYDSRERSGRMLTDHTAALGAVPVPRVRGRWPGNLDIVLGFIRSLREDYPMQFMNDLFEQYGSDTLNLRMLWEDQVSTQRSLRRKLI